MQGQLEHLREAAAIAGVRISGERGPTVRDVVSNRVRLSVLEWGPSQAPTIVLVHGGALTAHTWDLVCACLCDRYRCLAVDLRGHGDSEWPADADYSLDAISRDLSEFIAAECGAAPVLIGMSLGGLASIEVAANGM